MTQTGERARRDAERMYRRMLVSWAGDALELRRRGLDRPCVRRAAAPACPWRRAA